MERAWQNPEFFTEQDWHDFWTRPEENLTEEEVQAEVYAALERQYAEANDVQSVDDSEARITASIAAGKEPF